MQDAPAERNTTRRLILARDLAAPSYPLPPLRSAELITDQDRYALELIGGMCSRTTAFYVTVTRASSGVCASCPNLIVSSRRRKDGSWYTRYTCKGLGGWSTEAEALAGILAHVAAKAEGSVAA